MYEEINMPDSVLLYYNKVLAYSRQIKNAEYEVYAYLNIAYFYSQQNNTKKELEILASALRLAEKSKASNAIVKIYYYAGDLYFNRKRNFDLALLYYQKAVDKCPQDNKSLLAALHNDIAKVYIAKCTDNLALQHALTSISLARSINYKHQVSEAYKTLGQIYSHQHKLMKAINCYSYCYNLGCDECPKIKFHHALLEVADAYLQLNNKPKALEYYNKSLKLASDFKSPLEQALSLFKLGNFYQLSDQTISLKYYKNAFLFANQSKNIKTIRDLADTLTTVYKGKHDFKAALEYQSLSKTLTESINVIEHQESMAEWATRFEFEKLKTENDSKEKLSNLEIKRQKTYRNSALIVSILLLILGWVIWRNYKNKKKHIMLLEDQKKQIVDKNLEILAQVEEITSQKDEIERISNDLHQADETKFRFFTNLSHEFRTPLTLILNPAKNLLDTIPLNGEYKKQVEYIYNNANKLYDLTNQIMDLQKLDAGKLQLKMEKDDLIEYCVGIISSFESLCDSKKVTIKLEANCSKALAVFDKDKVGKILINLLSNAIKFCFENSEIEVKIAITNNRFHLHISDRGIGIPANEINDVFKRYVQASTNNYTGGTGIGLAYVKELVSFMKGNVTLESIENKGTNVSVEIPVDELEIKNENKLKLDIAFRNKTEKIKPFDITEYTEDNQNKAIIQIVEDNDQLRGFIAKLFQNEYRVILANNGQDGIDTAIENIPDIIISDVMMPLKNGFELCTTLKNDERTSHIPIILLTAKDGAQSSIEGYHTGADDYIIKPFDNEILTLKVRNILNTRAAISKQFNAELNILPNTGSYADIDKNFMKKCIQFIESNIGNADFTVDMLASELGFSRSNLYRKILSLTTFNPAELIRNIRMQHAARLLITSGIRVNEVALEVGYDSAAKFSQAFKKHYGVLPSEMV